MHYTRALTAGLTLVLGLFRPDSLSAQMLMRPAPYPQVTAAGAAWQVAGEPIPYGGTLYYPVGPSVYFDGNLMSRSGSFEGVPLYQDGTLSPFTIIYVPIGGNLMKPYERPRSAELAGTVGTRTPSFPVQRDGEVTSPFSPPYLVADTFQSLTSPLPIAATPPGGPDAVETPGAPPRVVIGSIPPAGSPNGFWLMYGNVRWYSAGPAVPFSPDRFVQIGQSDAFPVYRDRNDTADVIYIVTGPSGLLAPYRRK